jgi:hypothetical protein
MLAGIEEAFHTGLENKDDQKMTAIKSALAGIIDYAGLFPPAALDLATAVRNYQTYAQGKDAPALGRFIVDVNRLPELRSAAGDSLGQLPLSVIAVPDSQWSQIQRLLGEGFSIQSIEVKTDQPAQIERIIQNIPSSITAYFEISSQIDTSPAEDAILAVGARAKLRMGGLVTEAFPSADIVANKLKHFAARGLAFKGTAGLHHPIRSRHAFTYAPEGPSGIMHGFMNLLCAAALIYFGGEASDARALLNEEKSSAWKITPDAIGWHSFMWSIEQLCEVRERFFVSFGSCSFVEPMRDLEALGWL